MSSQFSNYSWGDLFRRFYGDPDWKNFFSEAIKTCSRRVEQPITVGNFTYSVPVLNAAREGSVALELVYLVNSEKIFKWASSCGLNIENCIRDIDVSSNWCTKEVEEVPKSTGCRFGVEEAKQFLQRLYSYRKIDGFEVEHCWSLSNSCGVLVDPNDIKRFVSLTFKTTTDINSKEEVSTGATMGDYLVYCLGLYERSVQKSFSGQTQLFENFVRYVRKYLSKTDLRYESAKSNPVITGILYDMCLEYNIFSSTYLKNISDFDVFFNKYLPVLAELFEFNWVDVASDPRLIFDIETMEVLTSVPKLGLLDAGMVLGHKLVGLDSYKDDDRGFQALEVYLTGIMSRDNPNLSEEQLWVGFLLYYGKYRTASSRIEARPENYTVPERAGGFTIKMSGVERAFDELQRNRKDMNVRRRFNASKADLALFTFRRLGISFKPLTNLNVPEKFAYLHLDYYKYIETRYLTDEESLIINNIYKEVDKMCTERTLALRSKTKKADEVVGRHNRKQKSESKHEGRTNAQRWGKVINLRRPGINEDFNLLKLRSTLYSGVAGTQNHGR
jgi:hypothetical protein